MYKNIVKSFWALDIRDNYFYLSNLIASSVSFMLKRKKLSATDICKCLSLVIGDMQVLKFG